MDIKVIQKDLYELSMIYKGKRLKALTFRTKQADKIFNGNIFERLYYKAMFKNYIKRLNNI
jgi:hypothetical protein